MVNLPHESRGNKYTTNERQEPLLYVEDPLEGSVRKIGDFKYSTSQNTTSKALHIASTPQNYPKLLEVFKKWHETCPMTLNRISTSILWLLRKVNPIYSVPQTAQFGTC